MLGDKEKAGLLRIMLLGLKSQMPSEDQNFIDDTVVELYDVMFSSAPETEEEKKECSLKAFALMQYLCEMAEHLGSLGSESGDEDDGFDLQSFFNNMGRG